MLKIHLPKSENKDSEEIKWTRKKLKPDFMDILDKIEELKQALREEELSRESVDEADVELTG